MRTAPTLAAICLAAVTLAMTASGAAAICLGDGELEQALADVAAREQAAASAAEPAQDAASAPSQPAAPATEVAAAAGSAAPR